MNFILIVVAVLVGLYLYNFIKDISYEVKSKKTHKTLLRWKKECEDNISAGKEVEKNKNQLKIVEKSLEEFQKNYIKKSEVEARGNGEL